MLLELIFTLLLKNITRTHGQTDTRTRSPLLGLLSEPKRHDEELMMEDTDYLDYIDPGHQIRNTDSEGGGFCQYVETQLYLYSYWWILIIVQILAPRWLWL